MNANFNNSTHHSHRFISRENGPRNIEFAREWRCHDCGRLLGKTNGIQMQIRRKPLQYVVGFPVSATCPGCGSLNVTNEP